MQSWQPQPRPLVSGASPSRRTMLRPRHAAHHRCTARSPRALRCSRAELAREKALKGTFQRPPTLACSPGPGLQDLIPHSLCPPAQLVLAPGVAHPPSCPDLAPSWHPCTGVAGMGVAPTKGPPGGLAFTCPAPGPGKRQPQACPLPAQPAQASAVQKPQRKCLFVPAVPKAKQFVVCDPNFLPFFQNITKLKTAPSSSPHPPGRQK